MIKITLDDTYRDNCSDEILWLDYKNITKVVEIGSKIYIDDGLISLQVKEIGEWKNGRLFYVDPYQYPKKPEPIVFLCLSLQVLISSCVRLRTVAPWAARRE